MEDVVEVKDKLNKSVVNVNIKHVNLSNLQNKSLVQLLNKNGYIKYMVYLWKGY